MDRPKKGAWGHDQDGCVKAFVPTCDEFGHWSVSGVEPDYSDMNIGHPLPDKPFTAIDGRVGCCHDGIYTKNQRHCMRFGMYLCMTTTRLRQFSETDQCVWKWDGYIILAEDSTDPPRTHAELKKLGYHWLRKQQLPLKRKSPVL